MTLLTDKEQAIVRTVLPEGMSAHGTGLAGEVRVHLDGHTAMAQGLIGNHGMHLGKGPFGVSSIRFPLLLARLLTMLAFRALSDVFQCFQADQAMRVSFCDTFGDDVIGVLRSPVSLVH